MTTSKETIDRFEKVTGEFVNTLTLFTQEQINTVPFAGSWTAAQVGRHLQKAFYHLPDLLEKPTEKADRDPGEKIEGIKNIFLDFSTKLKSPDFIIPEEKTYDKNQLISAFHSKAVQALEVAKGLDLTEICTGFALPGSGYLSRLELLFFSAAHTERHLNQLKNIYAKVSEKKLVG